MSQEPLLDLLIAGGMVIDPSQNLSAVADVHIREGKVVRVVPLTQPPPDRPPARRILDAQGLVVAPGFIDLHVHLREPGEEHKETIATGTRAAAAGGFTTVCCMPNTHPPLDRPEVVEAVLLRARAEGVVRVLPVAALTEGRAGKALAPLGELADAGAVAFSDDGDPVADDFLMWKALEYAAQLGRPVFSHAELPRLSAGGAMHRGAVSTRLGLPGIPAAAEAAGIARDLLLAEEAGAPLHLLHVSTAAGVELIRWAKARGVPVTAEVTPHHLTLTDRLVAGEGWLPPYDPRTKMNPPLRSEADRRACLAGLKDGTLDAVATDHAPHAWEDKAREYEQAAFGIVGLETALGVLLTLVHEGDLDLVDLVAALTLKPARILGALDPEGPSSPLVPPLLGTLQPGAPADLVLFDPQEAWEVDPERFHSRGANTPWVGQTLRGRVRYTLVAGEVVHREE